MFIYLFILSLLSLLLRRVKFSAWFAISHFKTQVYLSPRQARKQLTKVNNLSVLLNYIFCLSEIYHIVSQKQIHDSPARNSLLVKVRDGGWDAQQAGEYDAACDDTFGATDKFTVMGTKDDGYDYLFKGIDVISSVYVFGWNCS